ncbi:MAG: flavodoxin family protein [Tannerellaceae bacterium]|nr:flavodoxin family protein [Tannerellaceae bacterium]
MKVIAFNGSPRKKGNTYHAIEIVAQELEAKGIEVEIVSIGKKEIRGCIACNWCMKYEKDRCVFDNDPVNDWISKMKKADGIILGSPVYFAGINGSMKSFLDRAGYVLSRRPGALRYKVGAAVIAVRRSGGIAALDELNHYLNYFEMLVPAANYWNVIHGRRAGEALQDEEGKQIMRILGRNMAWLMQLLQYGEGKIEKPDLENKIATSFIR